MACLLLAACGPAHYTKPGSTQDDWANDHQRCEVYAQRLNENYSWSRAYSHHRLVGQCLEERGWVKQ
jgi:hypothetical protein